MLPQKLVLSVSASSKIQCISREGVSWTINNNFIYPINIYEFPPYTIFIKEAKIHNKGRYTCKGRADQKGNVFYAEAIVLIVGNFTIVHGIIWYFAIKIINLLKLYNRITFLV